MGTHQFVASTDFRLRRRISALRSSRLSTPTLWLPCRLSDLGRWNHIIELQPHRVVVKCTFARQRAVQTEWLIDILSLGNGSTGRELILSFGADSVSLSQDSKCYPPCICTVRASI